MSKKPLLITLLLVPLAGLGALVFLSDGGRPAGAAPAPPPEPEPVAEAPVAEVLLRQPEAFVRAANGVTGTTVLWPLKVELELVEASFLPHQEGVPAVGSGANARLSGTISGVDERGVAAEIRFVAGANAGRVLRCDADGRFGAADLYPGLSVVEVRGPGTLGSRREVRLRRGQDQLLNIGYGRPGQVFGRVQDQKGNGLANAQVWVDGTRVLTDTEGGFYVAAVAAGPVLCEVEQDGFALYQEQVWIAGGTVTPQERMTFTLAPASELRVAVHGNVGGPGPVQLYLLSDRKAFSGAQAQRNMSFPWHRINPVEVQPGVPVTIGKLPPEVVRVHAFRPGARAPAKAVNLAGNLRDLVIDLEPAPALTGRVLAEGEPVADATVRLEAPDRVRATLGYFTEAAYFLETAVLPNLPPGMQEVKTGSDGRFSLSSWSEVSPVRFIEARDLTGSSWAGRLVQPDESEVELELHPIDVGEATLVVRFPGRHQGLPIEAWIGGSPRATQVLASDQDLEIEGLVAGRWRMKVTWRAQVIRPEEEVQVDGQEEIEIALPPECIDGQSEEQWRRAGKEYPHDIETAGTPR